MTNPPTTPSNHANAGAGDHAKLSVTRVISPKLNLWQRLRDIWLFRELLVGLTRKELKVKYKNSVLGFMWSMLNPATTLIVYYVVFQIILKNGTPFFAIYLMSGILAWNMFNNGLMGACNSVVANGAIVRKVAFPREVLPLASVGSALVHFVLQSGVVIFFLIVFQRTPDWSYLPMLIPAVIALGLLTSALGILLGALDVRFRDMHHLLEIGLRVWFWATPIVYTYRLVRDKVATNGHNFYHWLFYLYRLNPMTPIVMTFQRAIYGETSPKGSGGARVAVLPDHAGQWWYMWQLLVIMGCSLAVLVLALKVFSSLEGNFAEEL